MVPKKAKDFKEATAKELGLSEKLVSDVIDFYWKTLRKEMSNLSHLSIELPNFGTFKVKHWALDNEIEKHKSIVKKREGRFSEYAYVKSVQESIAAMEKLKEKVKLQKEKFKEIKAKRYAEKNQNNLEEQIPNLGGSEESNIQDRSDRGCISYEDDNMQDMS